MMPGRKKPNHRNHRTLTNSHTANHRINQDKAHIETLLDGADARLLLSNRITVTSAESTAEHITLIFHAKRKHLQRYLNEPFIKKVTNIDGWHRVSVQCSDGQKREVRFSSDKKGIFAAEVTLKRDAVKITP